MSKNNKNNNTSRNNNNTNNKGVSKESEKTPLLEMARKANENVRERKLYKVSHGESYKN